MTDCAEVCSAVVSSAGYQMEKGGSSGEERRGVRIKGGIVVLQLFAQQEQF